MFWCPPILVDTSCTTELNGKRCGENRAYGMEVSEAKRLRALEEENGKLKRMLADAMLDNVALKDLLGKKW